MKPPLNVEIIRKNFPIFKNNPDKEYVVFCGVGGQGALSTKTMKDMGLKNVKNITGGMAEWEKLKK